MSDATLKVLFPGETVHVAEGVDAVVYPLSVRHLRKFNQAIEELIPKIASQVDLRAFSGEKFDIGKALPMVVPILLSDALDLIADCVEGVNILDEHFPHWKLPDIVDAWIQTSFGSEERVRPWIEVVEKNIARLTGESPGIWDTLSQSLRDRATTSTSSSTVSGPDAPTEDAPSLS